MDTAADEPIEGLRRQHGMWLLVLTVGRPMDAATATFDNVVAVRYDPNSLIIVGMEILGLRANLLRRPEFVRLYERAVRDPRAAAQTARTLMTA